MVDKSTARMLVYGALATLAIVLLVAIYALATKGNIQSQLEKKLDELKDRESEIQKRADEAKDARKKFNEAAERLKDAESKRQAAEMQVDDLDKKVKNVEHDKNDFQSESEILRRKLWAKTDQQSLEDLEKESEDKLMKELEEDGKEFFADAGELAAEADEVDPEDKQHVQDELKAVAEYKDAFAKVKQHLNDTDEQGDEEALEHMEEEGESNELYLEDLERRALKSKNHKWKSGKKLRDMNKLAHKMDLEAEALRVKYAHKKAKKADHDLFMIEQDAEKREFKGKDGKDDKYAHAVDEIAKELERDEEALDNQFNKANEQGEFDASKMLEVEAEKKRVLLAKLDQELAENKNLNEAERQERHALIERLEKELDEIESEAQHVEKGLERRHVRRDALKMAKAEQRLEAQPVSKGNLKHKQKVETDVRELVGSEHRMVEAMKKGDVAQEEELGAHLADAAEDLEEDAEHLFDEAEAGDFNDLDEKLIDEQLAQELEEAAQDMDHDAGGVEEDDHAREMREAGAHAEEQAHHVKDFKDGDIHLGALPIVQAKAHQANVDAQQLAQAVEEGDYEHEKELAHAEEADADQLDAAADNLQKELNGVPDGKMAEPDMKEDKRVVAEVKNQAKLLRNEAKAIEKQVEQHAKADDQKLSDKLNRARKLAKA